MKYEPPREGDIFRNYAKIDKVKRLLGFKLRVNLLDGLKETWEWFVKYFEQV